MTVTCPTQERTLLNCRRTACCTLLVKTRFQVCSCLISSENSSQPSGNHSWKEYDIWTEILWSIWEQNKNVTFLCVFISHTYPLWRHAGPSQGFGHNWQHPGSLTVLAISCTCRFSLRTRNHQHLPKTTGN